MLFALGINHTTAPVKIREKVAFSLDNTEDALKGLSMQEGIAGAAILSTCNRTEIYCEIDEAHRQSAANWLHDFHQLEPGLLTPYIYAHDDEAVVRHVLRVATGLDSMVLGEPQILGQMKQAYRQAQSAHAMAPLLDRLFQHTFAVAKMVRTDTSIGSSPVSVAYAAVNLARQIFDKLENLTVLLIGAGETIELAARHLKGQGVSRLIIANRTLQNAQQLASQFDAYAISLGQLEQHLHEADVIISSTAASEPVLSKPQVKAALKKRRHRPIFMVDIAIPRDIEESVGKLDDVFLYTLDDLQTVIDEGLKSRQEAAREAEEIIDLQVSHYMDWLHSLDAVSAIRQMRDQAAGHQAEVLKKALSIAKQQNPEAALEYMAHTLSQKLLHTPTQRLREAAINGRRDLLDAARQLLDLDNKDN